MTCLIDFRLRFLQCHSIKNCKTNSSYLQISHPERSFGPHNPVREMELLCLSPTMSSTYLRGPRKTELFILEAESPSFDPELCSVNCSVNTESMRQKFSQRQISLKDHSRSWDIGILRARVKVWLVTLFPLSGKDHHSQHLPYRKIVMATGKT